MFPTLWLALLSCLPAAGASDPPVQRAGSLYELMQQGLALEARGDFAGAAGRYEQALLVAGTTGRDQKDVLAVTYQLIYALKAGRQYDRAVEVNERFLAERERAAGPEDRELARGLLALAATHFDRKRYYDAEPPASRALRIARTRHDSEIEAIALNLLGALAASLDDFDAAGRRLGTALELRERAGMPDDALSQEVLHNIAVVEAAQGRTAEAEAVFRRALAMARRIFSPPQPQLAGTVRAYATLLRHTRRKKEAREIERILEAP